MQLLMLSSSRSIVLTAVLFLACSSELRAESLNNLSRSLTIDPTQTSVSGVSSGAYMALQLQVSYAKHIMRAGIIAGGPYRCASGKYISRWLDFTGKYTLLTVCTQASPLIWRWRRPSPDVAFSIRETERLAAVGLIDDPRYLAKHKVWMFSGAKDLLVPTSVMDTLQAYYQHFMPATHINYVKDAQASHGMITENQGGHCSLSLPPFINDCDYDAVGALLAQLYGSLQPKGEALAANLYSFNQQAFFDATDKTVSLHADAHLYIPTACQQGQTCKLHLALHGCLQTEDLIGDAFYTQSGYNAWAESNKIVVLYPQAKSGLANPQACWDWWGYSGEHYADKQGKQIRAIAKMLKQFKLNLD